MGWLRFVNHGGESVLPFLGKATAATRAALPSPVCVCDVLVFTYFDAMRNLLIWPGQPEKFFYSHAHCLGFVLTIHLPFLSLDRPGGQEDMKDDPVATSLHCSLWRG